MKQRIFSISFLLLTVLAGSCKNEKSPQACFNVIPLPKQVNIEANKYFYLDPQVDITDISPNEGLLFETDFLRSSLKNILGWELSKVSRHTPSRKIVLNNALRHKNKEAYQINISEDQIEINGASAAGVFYGIQTFLKSLPNDHQGLNKVEIPVAEVNDFPRFNHRGMMLDVSRHFSNVEEVKRFLDIMALHNMNVFHWHLTDDQGWRIEIKKYPELTDIGAWRNQTVIGRYTGSGNEKYDGKRYGGFYTQEDIKEVIQYADERHISIIPEIDMPGHMQALLAAYPEFGCQGGPYKVCERWGVIKDVLCVGNDKTENLIKDILDEVIDLFPGEYIHIGGDECVKNRWHSCNKCQNKIRKMGFKDSDEFSKEDYLQSHFMQQIASHIQKKGKTVIGWDEILEGSVIPNSIIMSWRGTNGGIAAARKGHHVIMSPTTHLYFDYSQTLNSQKEEIPVGGFINTERVYSYEPIPAELNEEQQEYILGLQANLWTEYMPNESIRQYQMLPRMAALAEVQWSSPEQKDYTDFLKRLPHMVNLYDRNNYNYAKHLYDVAINYSYNEHQKNLMINLSTMGNNPVYYTLDGSEPSNKSCLYTEPIRIDSTVLLKATTYHNQKQSSTEILECRTNKASFKPINLITPLGSTHIFAETYNLNDGIAGTTRVDDGRWLGFLNGFEAVINLEETDSISEVSLYNLSHLADCVGDPHQIEIFVSNNGTDFTPVATGSYDITTSRDAKITINKLNFNKVSAQYLKIKAQTPIQPKESPGAGRPYWLFISEISIL